MSNYNDRLKDYVDVKERIRLFYEKHPDGRLVTLQVLASTEPDNVPRIWAEAAAYRSPDDPQPGRGWSWIVLPGSTPYTKGSEIENAETSAWGRAIGALGIGIAMSIASTDEVAAKEGEAERPAPPVGEREELIGIETREGTIAVGGAKSKLEVRQSPEGPTFGFTLETAKGNLPQVILQGPLAQDVIDAQKGDPANLKGHWCRVKGRLYAVRQTGRSTYYRMHVTDFETKEYRLPAEAESVAMFDAEAEAELDPAVGA